MSAGSDRRMSLNQDEQAANDPANMDPPINQALMYNRGAANQSQEDGDAVANQPVHQEDIVQVANQPVEDVVEEQVLVRNEDFSTDDRPEREIDNAIRLDDDLNEPSNFQAWYIRSARNRSRVDQRRELRAELRGENSLSSEHDQDMEEANREGENKDDLVMNPFEGAVGISGASNVNVWEERPSVGAVNMMATWPGSDVQKSGAANSGVSVSWLAADNQDTSVPSSSRNLVNDNGQDSSDRSENRDYELPFMNRADRSERLEKLYRSLSLGPAESAPEQPINQNRSVSDESQAASISNVNIPAASGVIPRTERRNAAYLNNPKSSSNSSSNSVGGGSESTGCNSRGSGQLYNWQATKTSVHERFAFMFNNELLADIHFKVGRPGAEQIIPAHKFVLSVGSAVFDAMFNSALAMTEEEITLPDVEPQAFLALLRFLYSDEVQIGPETVMSTLYTAKKYAVPTLERHCVDFLKKNLSPDNACMLLTQARLFDEPQLSALCLEMIDKNTPEALSADGFTDLDPETLSVVLDRDTLRMKESKLFGAVLRWAEAQCLRKSLALTGENKRNALGRLLFQIRFPLMTVKEFAQGPAQSAVLTDKETVSLFLHYTVNLRPPDGFLDVPRCSMSGQELSICRFQQIESRWGYSGSSDKIRFIVDTRIFVVGFGLYGSIHGPSEYDVTIQLLHTGSGRILGSNEITFNSDGSNSSFRVMFKEPIEVQAGTNYTAVSTLKGLDSHYGTKGQRKVSLECHSGEKVTFQFSYAAGQNNGTSVEDGQIPEIIFYI